MSVQSHVAELRKKHQNLSDEVERAQRMPGSNDLSIAAMSRGPPGRCCSPYRG